MVSIVFLTMESAMWIVSFVLSGVYEFIGCNNRKEAYDLARNLARRSAYRMICVEVSGETDNGWRS